MNRIISFRFVRKQMNNRIATVYCFDQQMCGMFSNIDIVSHKSEKINKLVFLFFSIFDIFINSIQN